MSEVLIREQLEAGIYSLRMDDPVRENRLTDTVVDGLMEHLRELAHEPDLRVLLLRGRAEVFSAGGTAELLREVTQGRRVVKDLLLPDMMLGFPLPVVGVLEGHAVGGGLALALCCDITVAARESRYSANFADMGFTPGMGTMGLLPALVGHGLALEMMASAKYYKGRELAGRGLFTHVTPRAEVMDTALDIARRMAEKPRHVLALIKETLAVPRRQTLSATMSREHLMHQLCFGHPETERLVAENYIGAESELPNT
ncbi:polyketide synthase [Haliangium ochraceum]|nr:polyketide synthase [Haliangium ochraceum]ACY13736.1 Enoyl-CoA hydratase/isomerase [Haliangium ochraceum DSM 14365]